LRRALPVSAHRREIARVRASIFSMRVAVQPSMPGSDRSITMASGTSSNAFATASSPVSALGDTEAARAEATRRTSRARPGSRRRPEHERQDGSFCYHADVHARARASAHGQLNRFDITSTIDLQEVDNALNQARKEIGQRYDFKERVRKLISAAQSHYHHDRRRRQLQA
jgi:hypothetical protein